MKFGTKAVGLLFYGIWVYELWLLPDGRLDHWVALRVIDGSAFVVDLLGFEVWIRERVVGIVGNRGILMVDGCTGISAIGLFLGLFGLSLVRIVSTFIFNFWYGNLYR